MMFENGISVVSLTQKLQQDQQRVKAWDCISTDVTNAFTFSAKIKSFVSALARETRTWDIQLHTTANSKTIVAKLLFSFYSLLYFLAALIQSQ